MERPFHERVLLRAAELQGDEAPVLVASRPESDFADLEAVPGGVPAPREAVVAALQECEQRGWMILVKAFGPWLWELTASGAEVARQMAREDQQESTGFPRESASKDLGRSESPPSGIARLRQSLRSEQLRALQMTFDVFERDGIWPLVQYVESRLQRELDEPVSTVFSSMPNGLLYSGTPPNRQERLRLTVPAIALCTGSDALVSAFLVLLRLLVRLQAEFLPTNPNEFTQFTLNATQIKSGLAESPNGLTDEMIDKAYTAMETEPGIWEGRGSGDGGWTITVSPDIRKYRDVLTIEDYITRRGGVQVPPAVVAPAERPLAPTDAPTIINAPYSTASPDEVGVASYATDIVRGEDQLGILTDVNAFAALISAKSTAPPLSIGLFGDWGSGKTYFMHLLADRVRTLTNTPKSEGDADLPDYCRNVVQIEFNAWQYVDADLWASLATHILESLSRELTALTNSALTPQALLDKLESSREALRFAEESRKTAIAAREEAQKALVATRSRAIDAVTNSRADSLATLLLENPDLTRASRELEQAAGLDPRSVHIDELYRTLKGISLLVRVARQPRILWPAFGVALVASLIAFASYLVARSGTVASLAAVLSAALGLGTVALRILGPATRAASGAVDELLRAEDARETQKLRQLKVKEQEASNALDAADRDVRQAEQQLQDYRTSHGGSMHAFVMQRLASQDYYRHLGLTSVAHRDFARLSEVMSEPLPVGGEGAEAIRIDRIVLYVDDLDRCPPDQVIRVLQAVHLLLAFPLFVVVVGVDSRWLLGSVRRRYAELLGPEVEQEGTWAPNARSYLEKIFQIPYWIRPLSAAGFQNLLRSLTPHDQAAEPSVIRGSGEAGEIVPIEVGDETQQSSPAKSPPDPISSPAAAMPLPTRVDQRSLNLDSSELEYMGQLVAFVPSPREAKRMLNIYRLVRVTLAADDLSLLVASEHIIALELLAIQIGFPDLSPRLFAALLMAEDHSWLAFRAELERTVLGESQPADSDRWVRLFRNLDAVADYDPAAEIQTYKNWARRIARFSFEAGRILST